MNRRRKGGWGRAIVKGLQDWSHAGPRIQPDWATDVCDARSRGGGWEGCDGGARASSTPPESAKGGGAEGGGRGRVGDGVQRSPVLGRTDKGGWEWFWRVEL